MMKKLKDCKNLKEIYETVPSEYYEKGSAFLMLLMLFMIVAETMARYILRHQTFFRMVDYFYFVGYVCIVYVVTVLIIKAAGTGKKGIKEYFKNNPYDIFLIIMLLLGFISSLNAVDVKTAFLGDWFRQSGFRTYLIYASFYVCGKMIKKKNIKIMIYLSFAVVSTIQNMLLITNYFGYYGSKTGAFYNTNHSAYFITISIFAIIGLTALDKRIWTRIIGTVLFTINVWCLIVNNTFGCYLAVLFGFVFLIIVSLIKNRRLNKMVIFMAVLFTIISVWTDYRTKIISNNFGVTTSDIEKIANKSEDAKHAGTGRWELWVNAARYAVCNPMLGSGPDCLTIVEKAEMDKKAEYGTISEPHNEYLQYAAEVGFPAAVCYVTALVLIFILRMKRIKKADDSLIYDGAVVFAYCVSACFGVLMFYAAVYYFMFLGMTSRRTEYI